MHLVGGMCIPNVLGLLCNHRARMGFRHDAWGCMLLSEVAQYRKRCPLTGHNENILIKIMYEVLAKPRCLKCTITGACDSRRMFIQARNLGGCEGVGSGELYRWFIHLAGAELRAAPLRCSFLKGVHGFTAVGWSGQRGWASRTKAEAEGGTLSFL